jgi:hypothetical protein
MDSFLNRVYGFETSKIENRKHLRFPLSLPAECHYKSGEQAQQCRIVDICQQGLGFELDTQVGIRYGQNVLLTIFPPDKNIPVNAIVKLQWAKIPTEGVLKQRVGSRLLFMDPQEKAHLLLQAYAMKLVGVAKNSFASRALTFRYPHYRRTKH